MDKKDMQIAMNIELRRKNEELQSIINEMESEYNEKFKYVESLIDELESIKQQWKKSLDDLNYQKEEYRLLNKELLDIKREMNKIRKYL
jgi:chromosome segregation ATPase